MSTRDPGNDASFDWLRHAHRSERAPDGLRRRVLEQRRGARAGSEQQPARSSRWQSPGSWLAVAAAVAAGVWFAVLRPTLDGAASTPAAQHDAVTPTAEPARPGAPSRTCPTPLPPTPWRQDEAGATAMGLVPVSLETQTGCGPLSRRYLVHAGAALTANPPVLIVLHNGGQSAELAQIETRWWFDDLAQRQPLLLVYANAAPPSSPGYAAMHAGIWQTDEGAHPAVDDVAYLDAVVADVQTRLGSGQGEVFLAGYGSGAAMALTAALRHPGRYAGVAAFLPSRAPLPVDISARLTETGPYPLHSIFIAQRSTKDQNASNIAFEWATLFGAEPGPVRATRQRNGVGRIDSPLRSGVGLRVLTLPEQVDPFPGPGGGDRLARAESERRPYFLDGPGAAWDFFQRVKP